MASCLHAAIPHVEWVAVPPHVEVIALLGPDTPQDEARQLRSSPVEGLRALIRGLGVAEAVE